MNENFDDILTAAQEERAGQSEQTRLEPYDKAAYKEKKQSERRECFRIANETAESAASSEAVYSQYLNVQARFNRYSVTNALLLAAQCPKATRLATFEEWQKRGAQVEKGSKAIMLLEPGREFQHEDGSSGVVFNVKKVFDISQTNAPAPQAEANRDALLLLKALIHNPPCTITFDDGLVGGVPAQYKAEKKTLYVRHGLGGDELFRALARELAYAHLDESDGFSRNANTFKAKSIAFLVCVRNRIVPDPVVVPTSYADRDARTLKDALQEIRDVANTMHSSMDQVLSRQPREQSQQQSKSPRTGEAR